MRFICNLYPNADINGCRFNNGVYETTDRNKIKALEGVPWVKVDREDVECVVDIEDEEVEKEDVYAGVTGGKVWDKEELEKKTNKELRELLDAERINYTARDNKDKLIARLFGE